MKNGFSLIEAIVGIALILILFTALAAAIRLGFPISASSKMKIGAVSLAEEQMEKIKNLPYNEVGTIGGIPPGNIPQSESISLNDVTYARRALIQYVDDPKDSLAGADENGIVTDYKRVKIEVAWRFRNQATSTMVLISDIMPKGIETNVGGGTLIITVFNSQAQGVPLANVHIENASTTPTVSVDIFTNDQGRVTFPGTPAAQSYKIIVTKNGYSQAQTYDATFSNPSPMPGHLTVLEGQTTEASFSVDLTSAKTIETLEPASVRLWSDTFSNESKISTTSNVVVAAGELNLASSPETGYSASGYAISNTITPQKLNNWLDFSWSDNELASTTVKYQALYNNAGNWVLIPGADLAGNESGFGESPISLTNLATTTYPLIRLKANLSTLDASTTPSVYSWQLRWNSDRTPLPNIAFQMRGDKIIGHEADNDPIYKYSQNLSTNSEGVITVSNLEWDNYYIAVNGVLTGYDISESCPFQPANIQPNTNNSTVLVLAPHTNNTLLISVKDLNGAFISGADARLFKTGYDKTQTASPTCGQAFFTPLSASSDYTLEITKAGYEDFTLTGVNVNGQTALEITLAPL